MTCDVDSADLCSLSIDIILLLKILNLTLCFTVTRFALSQFPKSKTATFQIRSLNVNSYLFLIKTVRIFSHIYPHISYYLFAFLCAYFDNSIRIRLLSLVITRDGGIRFSLFSKNALKRSEIVRKQVYIKGFFKFINFVLLFYGFIIYINILFIKLFIIKGFYYFLTLLKN